MTPEEVAGAALACPPLVRAIRLAEWVGDSRELTGTGVLRPAVAVQACQALGIELPPGKLRSAKDVADLSVAWEVAVAADLVRVAASRAAAAPDVAALARVADRTAELTLDLAERIALAWLDGAGVPLGFPDDPCGECMSLLHALREPARAVAMNDLVAAVIDGAGAGAGPSLFDDLGTYVCPDCGQPHSGPTIGIPGMGDVLNVRTLELAEHVVGAVYDLVEFGAAVTGPGGTPGGTVALTPLGRLLAESVLHSISPAADLAVADLVESVAWLPPAVARTAAAPWLAARTPAGAVGELLAFAESFDGPLLRSIAIEIARFLGDDGAPAWREAAKRPGFGAYARQWLASQGETVKADDRDEPWLLVDTLAQTVGQLPDGLDALVLAAALRELTGGEITQHIADVRDCGHPMAAAMAGLLSGSYVAEATDGELFQLKVTLRGVSKPPVWRRILVPVTMSLGELHEVIVRAMGWDGGHLHVFSDGMFQYGSPDGELGYQDEDDIELDEVLSDPGDKLRYTYDFGDDWEHDIRLEKVLPSDAATAVPTCLAGKGACPPEDCGGAWGYASLKEAVADPDHKEHRELLEWLGLDDPSDFDPTAFNLDYANARVSAAGLSGLGVVRLRVRCQRARRSRYVCRGRARSGGDEAEHELVRDDLNSHWYRLQVVAPLSRLSLRRLPDDSVRTGRYLRRVSRIRLIAIRDTALSVDEVRDAIADPAAGGEVLFIGTVRDHDADKGVTGLGYSAHPSAEAELRRVTESMVAKFPDVIGVAAVHRVGDLAVGDLAVVVGVSCAHRGEAFHACHALIDELKATVPVWKHQRFTDGTDEWVGSA